MKNNAGIMVTGHKLHMSNFSLKIKDRPHQSQKWCSGNEFQWQQWKHTRRKKSNLKSKGLCKPLCMFIKYVQIFFCKSKSLTDIVVWVNVHSQLAIYYSNEVGVSNKAVCLLCSLFLSIVLYQNTGEIKRWTERTVKKTLLLSGD